MSSKKRYLVTHSDLSQSVSPVAEILNVPAENIKNGVNLLATEAFPTDDQVLEFHNLGVTSVQLDESQLNRLKENQNIIAVEEDVKMHILELMDEEIDQALDFEVTNGRQSAGQSSNVQDDAYQRGFQEGLHYYQNQGQEGQFGPNPVTPIRPFPVPPIIPILKQPIPWNINLVKAPGAWARGYRGDGIRVAVLDTGIANHPDLLPISGGISFIPGVVSWNDGHSHGTHCAGIIGARNNFMGVVGVAPACKLYAVKVLSDTGSGMSSWIIAGMDWAAAQGMHVVSMSLGGLNAPMLAYAQAVKRLQDRGTVVVIASGNSGTNASFPWVNSPANSIISGIPNASPIAVGAIDSSSIIANFSSRGGQTALWHRVDVVAPGVAVNSTIPGGGYAPKSGTSMATPHVAGAAALVKQRFPGISPASVRLRLMGTASDLGVGGYDQVYGAGLINCDRATL